jgi:hypothetical protein
LLGKVWRKLERDAAIATLLVPLWELATWWTLVVPNAINIAEAVVDWVWLPKTLLSVFVPGFGPGVRNVIPPDRLIMAVRVDFSAGADLHRIPLRDMCVRCVLVV